MNRSLVLASASPYRRALLARLCVPFEVRPADIDESVFKSAPTSPRDIAAELAVAKATAVACDATLVIGSDQLVAFDDGEHGVEILGKPGTAAGACTQLARLAGSTHTLWTAVCVFGETETTWVNETRLTMRALSSSEIERYVERDQPLDCAGSYKIEKLGIGLFDRVETDDVTAIEGLPLMRLAHELRRCGLQIP